MLKIVKKQWGATEECCETWKCLAAGMNFFVCVFVWELHVTKFY